jgi:hypothetical protein
MESTINEQPVSMELLKLLDDPTSQEARESWGHSKARMIIAEIGLLRTAANMTLKLGQL